MDFASCRMDDRDVEYRDRAETETAAGRSRSPRSVGEPGEQGDGLPREAGHPISIPLEN